MAPETANFVGFIQARTPVISRASKKINGTVMSRRPTMDTPSRVSGLLASQLRRRSPPMVPGGGLDGASNLAPSTTICLVPSHS